MLEEHNKKIQEIMQGMQCPKKFQCARDGFNSVCKARDLGVGLSGYVNCLESTPGCGFALAFGEGYLCHCPLRVYLAQNLRI